jgi:hypothetical protein
MKRIRVIAYVSGKPCPESGLFLKSFDPEAFHGIGSATFTDDPAKAMTFASHVEAFKFWQQETKFKRPDGKPNRPLTGFIVEIE